MRALVVLLLFLAVTGTARAQDPERELVAAIEAHAADESTASGFHRLRGPARFDALENVAASGRERIDRIPFERLSTPRRIDFLLLEADVDRRLHELARARREYDEALPLLPFHPDVLDVEALERERRPWPHRALAETLARVAATARETAGKDDLLKSGSARRVQTALEIARADAGWIKEWHEEHADADPLFAWWLEKPCASARAALEEFAKKLEESVLPELKKGQNAFAVGPEGIEEELRFAFLSFTAEELLALGEREFAAIQADLAATAAKVREGADWKAVLAELKADQVDVSEYRDHVTREAEGAIRFVREKELVPVPELAERCWRPVRIQADAQNRYPFAYYSGDRMGYAYATRSMEHEAKEAALRGNNRYFTRTVVPHELIPGHHLQGFFADRHETQRRHFSTSVLVEGWGFYTELLLDEEGYFRTPSERLGHLSWKLVRAARILVSVKYHLGRMTQEEMVRFLVDQVGLEEAGAKAEVERYMTYSPLYQASYMVGALAIRDLREECRKAWGDRFTMIEFHRRLLAENSIPIALIRYSLLDLEVPRDAR